MGQHLYKPCLKLVKIAETLHEQCNKLLDIVCDCTKLLDIVSNNLEPSEELQVVPTRRPPDAARYKLDVAQDSLRQPKTNAK